CLDRSERVLDVEEVAAAIGVAHDHYRLSAERTGGERGDRAGRPFPGDLARPVYRRQPDDQRRRAVQAASLLAETLRVVVRIGRRVEGSTQRRGVDEPGAVLGTAFEQVERRTGVRPDGASGVLARARGIRDTGEVQDGVAPRDQPTHGWVARVAAYVSRWNSCALSAFRPAEPNDLVVVSLEQQCRLRAQEAGGARDENLHRRRYSASRCRYEKRDETLNDAPPAGSSPCASAATSATVTVSAARFSMPGRASSKIRAASST